MNHALALLIVALCTPCTAAFQVHPKTSLRLQPSAGACAARRTVTASLFGNKQKEEAEERARIEAEQEALNARYARESQNDLVRLLLRVGLSS